jgi:hypothetical protein
MKHLFRIFLLTLFFNSLIAQEKHFVFIQSDNKLPFYVSVNGKLYSSTASGYLIVPKLAGGSYNFTVGFAQNAFPEQVFTTVVPDKDLGFELKNLGDKGWALFNLQSLDLIMATTASTNVVAKALSETSSAKSVEPVISFDKKKKAESDPKKTTTDSTSMPVAQSDAQQQVKLSTTDTVADRNPVAEVAASTVPNTKSTRSAQKESGNVKKVSEVTINDGVRLAFVDGTGKNSDTIQVIIPSSSPDANTASNASSATASNQPKNAGELVP